MDLTLRYGIESAVQLTLEDDCPTSYCAAPRTSGAEDIFADFERALAEPLEFPPLEKIAVPGDQVVLAIDPAVNQLPKIVAPVIATLLRVGVEPEGIGLLRAAEDPLDPANEPLADIEPSLCERIQRHIHDPEHRESNAYLATTKHNQRVYLSRLLTDADLVLPISAVRTDALLGHAGTNSTLYPLFSDTETKQRYARGAVEQNASGWRAEVDEVGWLLGVQFAIDVIPGRGDQALRILAGESKAVFEQGKRLLDEAYHFEIAEPASLVIATLEGPPVRQSWYEVARALLVAVDAVADGGSIVICCDLDAEQAGHLGPGMNGLSKADDSSHVLRQVRQELPEDAWPVLQLARALEKARVYLLSRLEAQLVEDLGMVPLADHQELARLASRAPSCAVLENAQHLSLSVG